MEWFNKELYARNRKSENLPLLFPTGLKPAALFLAEAILFPRLATDRMMVGSNWNLLNPVNESIRRK